MSPTRPAQPSRILWVISLSVAYWMCRNTRIMLHFTNQRKPVDVVVVVVVCQRAERQFSGPVRIIISIFIAIHELCEKCLTVISHCNSASLCRRNASLLPVIAAQLVCAKCLTLVVVNRFYVGYSPAVEQTHCARM